MPWSLAISGVVERNRETTVVIPGRHVSRTELGGVSGSCRGVVGRKKFFFSGVSENFSSVGRKKIFFLGVTENFSSVVVDVVRNPSSRRV